MTCALIFIWAGHEKSNLRAARACDSSILPASFQRRKAASLFFWVLAVGFAKGHSFASGALAAKPPFGLLGVMSALFIESMLAPFGPFARAAQTPGACLALRAARRA